MEGSWIEDARRRIDLIDREIMRLLDERMEICRSMGRYKRAHGIPLRDLGRERRVLDKAGSYQEVFKAIIDLCLEAQRGG